LLVNGSAEIRIEVKMRKDWWPALALTVFVGASVGACSQDPVKPDRAPVIASLVAYPDSMGPSVSAVVVCTASDPDGDILVYD